MHLILDEICYRHLHFVELLQTLSAQGRSSSKTTK